MSIQEHKRYVRGEEVKHDKNQLMFSSSGQLKANPNIVIISHETLLPLDKQMSFPFCLGLSEFRKFLVSNKQGISRNLGKCPLCRNGLYLQSLFKMSKFTGKGYADWVFSYKGFFKKIKWNEWRGRLKLIGWTQEFWDRYHELKGEREEEGGPEDSFMDYINRKGEEAAAEWNQQDRGETS